VDIQGVSNVLTDPQIHCQDKSRFGKGNLGQYGILMFFNTHTCNDFCKKLGLVNPKDTKKLSSDFEIMPEKGSILMLKDEEELARTMIKKLCDLCRKPVKVSYTHYLAKREQEFETWCNPCTTKRNNSMKRGNCSMCKATFYSS